MSKPYPPPPAGFTEVPPPPAGFTLVDQATKAPPAQPTIAPDQGIASGAKSVIHGLGEQFGVDPNSPVLGTAWNYMKGLTGLVEAYTSPFKAIEMLKSQVAPTKELISGISESDSNKALHGLGGMAGQVIQLGMGKAGAGAAAESEASAAATRAHLKTIGLGPASEDSTHFATAVGAKRTHESFADMTDQWERAKPDLKLSEDEYLKKPVAGTKEGIIVGKHAGQRIYKQEIQPYIDKVETIDLKPLAKDLKSKIPADFTDAEKAEVSANIDEVFGREVSGPVAERIRQRLRADARTNLAANDYQRSAVEKQPRGWMLDKSYEAMRNYIADEVKATTGQDIRGPLDRYGAVTEATQAMSGTPVDPTLMERLKGSYFTGSERNIKGQATRIIGAMSKGNDALIKKAFAKAPASSGNLPTKPTATIGSQLDLMPAGNVGEGPLLEPPAGTATDIGKEIFKIQQRTNKEARSAPPATIEGVQQSFLEMPGPLFEETFGPKGKYKLPEFEYQDLLRQRQMWKAGQTTPTPGQQEIQFVPTDIGGEQIGAKGTYPSAEQEFQQIQKQRQLWRSGQQTSTPGQMDLITTEHGGGATAPPKLFGMEQTKVIDPYSNLSVSTGEVSIQRLRDMSRAINTYLKEEKPATDYRRQLLRDVNIIEQEIYKRGKKGKE